MKNLKTKLAVLFLSLVCVSTGFTQITPSADAYINSASPTTNYGSKTLLDVDGATQITYIQFNLASIRVGSSISQATLKLYVNTVITGGSFNVDYVNGAWAENTITANLAPALGGTIASGVPITAADKNQYILINVTPAVVGWLNASQANDGIALVADGSFNATFDSKENTTTSHPAELDIVFAGSEGGGTITGVLTGSSSGLTGGGTSGTLNLSLSTACAAKQILQWSGSAWACASPGTGTVTSVGSGAGLTGGPITGSGTLSIASAGVSNSMLANPSLTISPGTALTGGGSVALGGSTTLNLDTTKVPLLAAANTFSMNQTVNGTLTASSFSGNGAALTNVTAANSNELGGQPPNAYAQLGAANTFSNNQTVNGMVTAKSSSFTIGASTTNASDPAISGFGIGLGVLGSASSSSGIGMEGETSATGGVGVYGLASASTGGSYGVYGAASSSSAYGVFGNSPYIGVEGAATDIGVYGAASGNSIEGTGSGHAGVWGDTGGAAGDFVGVLGTADKNVAGYFFNNGSISPTLFAENYASSFGDEVFASYILYIDGSAIIGDPGCNTGFIALQLGQDGMSGCSNYTMAGGNNGHTYINAATNGAVHIRINSVEQLVATSGNVDVLGTLSKGGGSFKIDHPLDPANKYLYHSFVESPDMMNIYNGNVTTDASGEAAVKLPEWFETLNRDFRYQLTVIGQFAQAIVAGKVANHQFVVKTDKPNVEVSWQVTGIRQDEFANAHRIPVEAEKAPADRGHYLYPDLVGAPETARIGYMAPVPGSEQVVHARPTLPRRGNASPSQQRTPPIIPAPPTMPAAPKVVSVPHPAAPAGQLEINQE
jgi:hypothetical protein